MNSTTPRRVANRCSVLALAALLAVAFSLPASAITIDTVPVGDAGNAADTTGRGSVAYDYAIGTYEVTNAQYAAFLNAKAASDPLNLYKTWMGSATGGITRSGTDGSYVYDVLPNRGNKPVSVTWYDAVRFANWLHNGQGAGDTESGAYTILGGTPVPSNAQTISRNLDATWFLPTRDEWYKAAYYDPTLNDGAGGYWDYATRSNAQPTLATANSAGDISNPGANVVNYGFAISNVTTVGSAGPLSDSYYGTSDQTGNLAEWSSDWDDYGNDPGVPGDYFRDFNGGGWDTLDYPDLSAHRSLSNTSAVIGFGFRVATVPEPSTVLLGALGMIGLLCWRIRRKETRAKS